jgi:hypothetical protein
MKYLLSFLLIFYTAYCTASVYQQTDDSGTAVYSDIPLSPTSKQVDLSNTTEGQISSSPSATPTKDVPSKPAKKEYITFAISSPTDQQTIQNEPVITVKFKVEPELQKGDMIQVFLDGTPQGKPTASTTVNLDLVQRGQHQLSATLMDANQATLKQSNLVTIFVHRASVNQPSQKANQ